MKFSIKNSIFVVLLFVAGFFIGQAVCVDNNRQDNNNDIRDVDINNDDDNVFTNPLLDCTDLNVVSNRKTNETRDEVAFYIESAKTRGNLTDAAVYFRDLNNGPWFGIDEKADFSPASLLKVPLMMAVYKQAMLQPGFINEKVSVTQNGFNAVETIRSQNALVKGDQKTVAEVVEYMIKYSDNNASYILNNLVNQEIYDDTYRDLGIEIPNKASYTISVRTYASFFRILYNSTYLWQPFSEEALRLLVESEFKDGLLAGVPGNVKVAHKFGERDLGDGKRQIHDCGIIYDKETPYILCIMTRGDNSKTLVEIISNISTIVYKGINK